MSYKLDKPFTDKQRADFVCEHQGLNYYEDDNCIIMYSDSESVADGVVIDLTQDPTWVAEQDLKQFQTAIQYQHDAFNEYSREIVYQIQYNTALGNTTLVTSLNNQLQTEQEAVISRINAITEAYTNESNE